MISSPRFYVAVLVFVLAAITLGYTDAQQNKPIVLPTFETNFATWQPESQAQVVSITTTTTRFLGGTIVLNAGKSQLKAVQIGWMLEGHAKGKEKTFLKAFTTSYIPVAIDSGKVGIVLTSDWSTPEVLQYTMDNGLDYFSAQVGIVGAKFADGSMYTYNLAEKKGFLPSQGNTEVYKLLDRIGAETLNDLNKQIKQSLDAQSGSFPVSLKPQGESVFRPAPFTVASFNKPSAIQQPPPPAFCCKKASSATICAASVNSCTVNPCLSGPGVPPPNCNVNCACQTCDVVPSC